MPILLLLLLCACGRLGFDAGGGDDAGAPDAGAADATVFDAAPLGPFGEATLVAELAAPGTADDDPSLTGDLLELYFKSDRGGGNDFDIWLARRESPDDPWDDPVEVVELSSNSFDGTPEVSIDGLTITLSSDRPGGDGGGIDLWIATREDRDDPWETPAPLVGFNSPEQEYAAVTDEAGDTLIFNRSVVDQSFDLLQSRRAAGVWSAPVPLVGLSTAGYEADSHLSGDGLELTFAGELPGGEGRDIYLTRRDAVGADFAPPERLAELASATADEDPWLSPDRRLIVFSSDRSGDQELYTASR